MEYKIGDIALIRVKVEDVDFDEDGVTVIVSLPWAELKAMDPEELVAEKEAKRQQETTKAAGHKEAHIPLPPGGHKLAKMIAELN